MQKKVAQLEGGVAAHVFGTGMAATTSVVNATMKVCPRLGTPAQTDDSDWIERCLCSA